MTYAATKFEVATSKGLGGDTFARNVTDVGPFNFGTKLIYHTLFSKEKSGYNKYPHTLCFENSVDLEWIVYLSSAAVVINSKAGLMYSKFIQLDKVLKIYLDLTC